MRPTFKNTSTRHIMQTIARSMLKIHIHQPKKKISTSKNQTQRTASGRNRAGRSIGKK
jgi:hypothetical protein